MARFLSQNAPTPMVLTHFFRTSTNRGSTKAVSLPASILIQVLDKIDISSHPISPLIIRHIVPLSEQFSSCEECPYIRLWSALKSIFANLPSFTLLVDGFDECSDKGQSSLLLQGLDILSKLSDKRVIILSRYNTDYGKLMQQLYHVSMDKDVVSSDIMHFVRQELDRTPIPASFHDDIMTKVLIEAQGMFLWAKMMIEYLKRAITLEHLRKRLSRFPIGLSAVYQQFVTETAEMLEVDELNIRREIFLLLIAAVRPFSVDEISLVIATRSVAPPRCDDMLLNPEEQILRLCWPLVIIKDQYVQLIHASVTEFLASYVKSTERGSLRIKPEDSHNYMARKCLNVLRQTSFSSPMTVLSLLRHNVYPAKDASALKVPEIPVLYEYASLFWHVHVIASTPEERLALQANQFLKSKEFITWAEFLFYLKSGFDMGPVLSVKAQMLAWHCSIPYNIRLLIGMRDYFVGPYHAACAMAEKSSNGQLLHCLLLHRIGSYLNLAADRLDDTYMIRKLIKERSEAILSLWHPLTLRTAIEFGNEMINQFEYDESVALLSKVYKIQLEVLGFDVYDSFYATSHLALAQYYQTSFRDSAKFQEHASAGLLRTLGPTNKDYLKSQLYLGLALEAQGHLNRALEIYEHIWKLWATLYSPDNGLAMMSQVGLASVHRKKRNFEEAEKNAVEVLANRQRVFGEGNYITIDTALHLVFLYRDMERYNQARAMLDLAIDMGAYRQKFVRVAQVEHLRSCLDVDEGHPKAAMERLQKLLQDAAASNHPNNRELLRARVTLADLFRGQGKPDEVLQFFTDLVEPMVGLDSSSEIAGRPESALQLMIAEKATRLLIINDTEQADKILNCNGLCWKRRKDFWIPAGGPFAGT